MEKFSNETVWVATSGWRGYEQPVQAVCGANDTGMWPDSPCRSDVREKEIGNVRKLLRKEGIRTHQQVCRSSNVFCAHVYLKCLPSQQEKAREIIREYLADNNTELLYICES